MNIILFDMLSEHNIVKRSDRAYEHITSILKLKAGDTFRAGCWGVSRGEARIEAVDDEGMHFSYRAQDFEQKTLPLVLLIAQIRPICMKRVLRFVGECGVHSIILTPCQTSEKSYLSSGIYQPSSVLELIREGCEVSKGFEKPGVYFARDVDDAIHIATHVLRVKNRYLLHLCSGSEKLSKKNENLSCIAIGPERGWSDEEVGLFIKNGFLTYNIGQRVFRAEESAIVSVYPWL